MTYEKKLAKAVKKFTKSWNPSTDHGHEYKFQSELQEYLDEKLNSLDIDHEIVVEREHGSVNGDVVVDGIIGIEMKRDLSNSQTKKFRGQIEEYRDEYDYMIALSCGIEDMDGWRKLKNRYSSATNVIFIHKKRENYVSTESEDHKVGKYLHDGESVAKTVEVRPTGIIGWIKSHFGIEIIRWFVTNHRLIETRNSFGEFTFKDISHKKISSIKYEKRIPRSTIASVLMATIGTVLVYFILLFSTGEASPFVLLIAVIAVLYAVFRRQQVLVVTATGGQKLSLVISNGEDIDQIILYLHTARTKREKE